MIVFRNSKGFDDTMWKFGWLEKRDLKCGGKFPSLEEWARIYSLNKWSMFSKLPTDNVFMLGVEGADLDLI